MKVAVVGAGVMGSNHIRVLNELGCSVFVCDTNTDKLNIISNKFNNIHTFINLQELLDNIKLDAITIATPTDSHILLAITCLTYTKNIFIEKPLASNIDDAEAFVNLIENNNYNVAVGYIERYNPSVQALKLLLDNDAFGQITSINIRRVGGISRSADNVVLDLMTHDLDLLLYLLNRMPNDYKIFHRYSVDKILNSSQALLDFDTCSAVCEANWISPIKIRQIHITGTQGYCEVDLINQTITRIETGILPKLMNRYTNFTSKQIDSSMICKDTVTFKKEPLKEELNAFLNSIRYENRNEIITVREALNTLRLTFALAYIGELTWLKELK